MIPVALDWLPYRRQRAVPPPEPVLEVLTETVQLVTSYGRWQREPGCTYLTARDLPEPYGPDPVVFGNVPRVDLFRD